MTRHWTDGFPLAFAVIALTAATAQELSSAPGCRPTPPCGGGSA